MLARPFAMTIASHLNNPVYETFNLRYVDHFSTRLRVIPIFGIVLKSLEELDFNPDNIEKFQFPETPSWTYLTPIVNLTLLYAKKDQMDPSIYCLQNVVKNFLRDHDFIYTDGSSAVAVIDDYSSIERLPDKSCSWLGRDGRWRWKEIYHFLWFKVFSPGHLGLRLDSSSCPQDTGTPSLASTVPREKNIILLDSQLYWHQG